MPALPTMLPAQLPDAARRLYRAGLADRIVTVEAADQDAAEQVVAANLGWWAVRHERLGIRPVASTYRFIQGPDGHGGGLAFQLRVFRRDVGPDAVGADGTLLVAGSGASVSNLERGKFGGLLRLRVPHPTATDAEHDTARLLTFELEDPQLLDVLWTGTTEIAGRVGKLRIADADHEAQFDQTCTFCDDPHPIGPYLPDLDPALQQLYGHRAVLALRPAAITGPDGAPTNVG